MAKESVFTAIEILMHCLQTLALSFGFKFKFFGYKCSIFEFGTVAFEAPEVFTLRLARIVNKIGFESESVQQ